MVAPAFRRRGLARRLVTRLIAIARHRGLASLEIDVSEYQPDILAFYQGLGFDRVEETEEERKKGLSHSASPDPVVHLKMALQGR